MDAYADLWWIPVGAGGHVVIHTSRWWELTRAAREHRAPRPLFHAALEVCDGDHRYAIEMTPAWGNRIRSRGVVATGPVGSTVLGRLRLFRYEIRCWEDGIIPDLALTSVPPHRIALTASRARTVLDRVRAVPRFTWGRDPLRIGDMWNSNSLISYALEASGLDVSALRPPDDGSAPGWASGIAAARRSGGRLGPC